MKNARLVARTEAVAKISLAQRERMFAIFQKYYSHVSWDSFLRDLEDKNEVIVLLTPQDGAIQGFSTLKFFQFEMEGRAHRAVFSGDTILEESFWGQTALQRAFIGRLVKEKLKSPFSPFYWFLISKGFKTYLLLANNFTSYFPRIDNSLKLQCLTHACAATLFPNSFDAKSGLILFGPEAARLKESTAPLTQELIQSHPLIEFFVKLNPTWNKGTELACLAEANFSTFLWFFVRTLGKHLGLRSRGKTRHHSADYASSNQQPST